MKIINILLSLFLFEIIFLSGGCTLPNKDYRTPDQITEQISNELMEALINKDIPKLKGLMCPKFQEKYDNLDEKIQGIFDFIGGDIISYEIHSAGRVGSRSAEEGWVKQYAMPEISNVKVGNKTYRILYTFNFINKAEPKLLGISSINVILKNDNNDISLGSYQISAN